MEKLNDNINELEFDSYGDAISYILKSRGIRQKKLIQEIATPNQNLKSLQSQMSKWLNYGNVSKAYQNKINAFLNVSIKQFGNGKWKINYKKPSSPDGLMVAKLKNTFNRLNDIESIFKSIQLELELSKEQKESHATIVYAKIKEVLRDIDNM